MTARFAALSLVALGLAGCAGAPSTEDEQGAAEPPEPFVYPAAQPGAIYAGGFELFADLRARDVGDILTVRLVERTDAENESSTNASKSSDVDTGMPIIAGGPVTSDGQLILNNEIQAERSFSGSTDSSQSNRVDGTITVTVVGRLPNGNLSVAGEKYIAINQGEELIRLSGTVRAVDIGPDNSIPSTKVADARIDYRGSGTLASSNSPGWLTRFFNSPWFPF